MPAFLVPYYAEVRRFIDGEASKRDTARAIACKMMRINESEVGVRASTEYKVVKKYLGRIVKEYQTILEANMMRR